MSLTSRLRQQDRLQRAVQPREGQTLEEAQRDVLMVHDVLTTKAAAVLAEAKLFFGNDDLKFASQRGRFFLLIKTISGAAGETAWRQLSTGPTPVEAIAEARIRAENLQRGNEAKAAGEKPVQQPATQEQTV